MNLLSLIKVKIKDFIKPDLDNDIKMLQDDTITSTSTATKLQQVLDNCRNYMYAVLTSVTSKDSFILSYLDAYPSQINLLELKTGSELPVDLILTGTNQQYFLSHNSVYLALNPNSDQNPNYISLYFNTLRTSMLVNVYNTPADDSTAKSARQMPSNAHVIGESDLKNSLRQTSVVVNDEDSILMLKNITDDDTDYTKVHYVFQVNRNKRYADGSSVTANDIAINLRLQLFHSKHAEVNMLASGIKAIKPYVEVLNTRTGWKEKRDNFTILQNFSTTQNLGNFVGGGLEGAMNDSERFNDLEHYIDIVVERDTSEEIVQKQLADAVTNNLKYRQATALELTLSTFAFAPLNTYLMLGELKLVDYILDNVPDCKLEDLMIRFPDNSNEYNSSQTVRRKVNMLNMKRMIQVRSIVFSTILKSAFCANKHIANANCLQSLVRVLKSSDKLEILNDESVSNSISKLIHAPDRKLDDVLKALFKNGNLDEAKVILNRKLADCDTELKNIATKLRISELDMLLAFVMFFSCNSSVTSDARLRSRFIDDICCSSEVLSEVNSILNYEVPVTANTLLSELSSTNVMDKVIKNRTTKTLSYSNFVKFILSAEFSEFATYIDVSSCFHNIRKSNFVSSKFNSFISNEQAYAHTIQDITSLEVEAFKTLVCGFEDFLVQNNGTDNVVMKFFSAPSIDARNSLESRLMQKLHIADMSVLTNKHLTASDRLRSFQLAHRRDSTIHSVGRELTGKPFDSIRRTLSNEYAHATHGLVTFQTDSRKKQQLFDLVNCRFTSGKYILRQAKTENGGEENKLLAIPNPFCLNGLKQVSTSLCFYMTTFVPKADNVEQYNPQLILRISPEHAKLEQNFNIKDLKKEFVDKLCKDARNPGFSLLPANSRRLLVLDNNPANTIFFNPNPKPISSLADTRSLNYQQIGSDGRWLKVQFEKVQHVFVNLIQDAQKYLANDTYIMGYYKLLTEKNKANKLKTGQKDVGMEVKESQIASELLNFDWKLLQHLQSVRCMNLHQFYMELISKGLYSQHNIPNPNFPYFEYATNFFKPSYTQGAVPSKHYISQWPKADLSSLSMLANVGYSPNNRCLTMCILCDSVNNMLQARNYISHGELEKRKLESSENFNPNSCELLPGWLSRIWVPSFRNMPDDVSAFPEIGTVRRYNKVDKDVYYTSMIAGASFFANDGSYSPYGMHVNLDSDYVSSKSKQQFYNQPHKLSRESNDGLSLMLKPIAHLLEGRQSIITKTEFINIVNTFAFGYYGLRKSLMNPAQIEKIQKFWESNSELKLKSLLDYLADKSSKFVIISKNFDESNPNHWNSILKANPRNISIGYMTSITPFSSDGNFYNYFFSQHMRSILELTVSHKLPYTRKLHSELYGTVTGYELTTVSPYSFSNNPSHSKAVTIKFYKTMQILFADYPGFGGKFSNFGIMQESCDYLLPKDVPSIKSGNVKINNVWFTTFYNRFYLNQKTKEFDDRYSSFSSEIKSKVVCQTSDKLSKQKPLFSLAVSGIYVDPSDKKALEGTKPTLISSTFTVATPGSSETVLTDENMATVHPSYVLYVHIRDFIVHLIQPEKISDLSSNSILISDYIPAEIRNLVISYTDSNSTDISDLLETANWLTRLFCRGESLHAGTYSHMLWNISEIEKLRDAAYAEFLDGMQQAKLKQQLTDEVVRNRTLAYKHICYKKYELTHTLLKLITEGKFTQTQKTLDYLDANLHSHESGIKTMHFSLEGGEHVSGIWNDDVKTAKHDLTGTNMISKFFAGYSEFLEKSPNKVVHRQKIVCIPLNLSVNYSYPDYVFVNNTLAAVSLMNGEVRSVENNILPILSMWEDFLHPEKDATRVFPLFNA